MERRGCMRFYFSLPMKCEVRVPDSQKFWATQAVLKNISQGGLYFECKTVPGLTHGNVGEFIFTTTPPKCGFINSPIKTRAVVKRVEARGAGLSNFGVAVQFLSDSAMTAIPNSMKSPKRLSLRLLPRLAVNVE